MLLQASSKYNESYATAYVHQLAWTKDHRSEKVVYARLAGKPTFVRAMAGTLHRGGAIRVQFKEDIKYLYGDGEARCFYHKTGKIGIATYFSRNLFNYNSDTSYLIGQTNQQINQALCAVLKMKPVIFLEGWDIKKILSELQLLTELETYNVKACEVLWDKEKIHGEISRLVKGKGLVFV